VQVPVFATDRIPENTMDRFARKPKELTSSKPIASSKIHAVSWAFP